MTKRTSFIAFIITVLWLFLGFVTARAQDGTRANPYQMDIYWKKKNGKMAVFYKSKITKEYRLTDYIFDTDCKESFAKDNKVNFLDKRSMDPYNIYPSEYIGKKYNRERAYVKSFYGIIPVKKDGLYTVLDISTHTSVQTLISWKLMFPATYNSMTIVASHTSDNKIITNWAIVTRPGSNLKGLLRLNRYERNPVLLDCEYDEISPAAKVSIIDGGKECHIFSNREPSFVFSKGNRYGVVLEGGKDDIMPPRYDLKSFTHTDPIKYGSSTDTPYRVRSINSWTALLERGDSLFIACKGKEMYIQGSPDKIPTYREIKIANFEGERYPPIFYIFGDKNDISVLASRHDLLIPHRGTTSEIKPFKIFRNDTLSTYLLSGSTGCSLYNARKGTDLITEADTIYMMPDTEGFISVTPKGTDTAKTAFLTRDYSEAVLLDNIDTLPTVAETTKTIGTTQILNYKGSIGLYDSATGFALPCSFDSIVPATEVIDSIPEPFSRFFFTYKDKRIGMVSSAGAVAKPTFGKAIRSTDKRSIVLKKDVYCYKHSDYELCITAENDDRISMNDNLDTHLTNFVTEFNKHYKNGLYIPDTYFALAADLDDKEMLARTYDAAACIAINCAIKTNNKENAMSDLNRADTYHARAVELSGREISDIDLPGIRERVTEYHRLLDIAKAEAEAARQKQMEEERIRQAKAAQRQRQQRAEAWAQLAGTLSQLSQNINSAIRRSSASSRPHSTGNTNPTVTTHRQTSATSVSSSTSATQRTPTNTTSFANRKMIERAYDLATDIVMKYYYGKYSWDLNAVRREQQDMREIRALAKKQGFTIQKSKFEDVSAPYRK